MWIFKIMLDNKSDMKKGAVDLKMGLKILCYMKKMLIYK